MTRPPDPVKLLADAIELSSFRNPVSVARQQLEVLSQHGYRVVPADSRLQEALKAELAAERHLRERLEEEGERLGRRVAQYEFYDCWQAMGEANDQLRKELGQLERALQEAQSSLSLFAPSSQSARKAWRRAEDALSGGREELE